ncbi:MAG: M20/M25/M40 family metallo-hydrolase [Armatimonadota bacterium]|nr:M20/M25/M40 family metallo-hydrolase [Armatimonadota bacterium]
MSGLLAVSEVERALDDLQALLNQIIDEAVAICEVSAPTFHEHRRAEHVLRRMRELGLGDPHVDADGNVVTELPGAPDKPMVVITAHLDTVFGPDVATAVRRDGARLFAPGIGDNSMGVAAMLWLGRILKTLPARGTLVLGANVGEEGLGNLRGARALWGHYGARAAAWIVLEGATFNRGVHTGVCSRRLEITYRAKGGHSWLDFGQPSAVHALGRLIDQIAQTTVPSDPKTTYNVGVIRGGTTVNTIASEAGLVLDMRSEDPKALANLAQVVEGLVSSIAAAAAVEPEVRVLGDRPGGRLAAGHPLIALVEQAASVVGTPVRWESASTDANVPLSHGAAAVCLGIARGEGAHTLEETLDTSVLAAGLRQACLVIATLLQHPLALPE